MVYITLNTYLRAPFLDGYKIHGWTKKEVQGNYFYKSTLVSSLQSAIRTCHNRISVNFHEANFVEVPIIYTIHENCSRRRKPPYGSCIAKIHLHG